MKTYVSFFIIISFLEFRETNSNIIFVHLLVYVTYHTSLWEMDEERKICEDHMEDTCL